MKNQNIEQAILTIQPEDFEVEGSGREFERNDKRRSNKKKECTELRNQGKEYLSRNTNKLVPARTLKMSCNGELCKKFGKNCLLISEQEREDIFKNFYKLGNLINQREFIARHVEAIDVKQKTIKGEHKSRRQKTIKYFLTLNKERKSVCKKFFINTLGISEKSVRTVLAKLTELGTLEKDKRGGRQSKQIMERDQINRLEIEKHINRYPRVESHYCRAKTTKEYLHSELSLRKMYAMFLRDRLEKTNTPSFSTYRRVFKSKNVAFEMPKKNQCTLCQVYRESNENKKLEIQAQVDKHVAEKKKVREIKEFYKMMAKEDKEILCGTFDLQQVLYLPISNESALFYKRRLANFNLTFYNIADKQCSCYTWNETISKRGASEISSCIYKGLQAYDEEGIKSVFLFSDGCCGQNKNTIMACMLLYTIITSKNIKEISLRFFESFHGQSEGDSVHSAISYALKHAGNVFIPSQLHTVFSLARRHNPYKVFPLEYSDFVNFKSLSQQLRILTIRTTDCGAPVNWTKIMEIKVSKDFPNKIFVKNSHMEISYKILTLKRQISGGEKLQKLNKELQKLSKEKSEDLVSLCRGTMPIIRSAECVHFYESLPYNK